MTTASGFLSIYHAPGIRLAGAARGDASSVFRAMELSENHKSC
jgi:hypothetical protein